MAYYLVKAKYHENLLNELRKRLDSGEIKKMKPFGQALQYGLDNARLDEHDSNFAVWEEEDYCNPPLAQERAAVLDTYFTSLEVKRVKEGEGWQEIESLQKLWTNEKGASHTLTGKYNSPTDEPKRSKDANERIKKIASVLMDVAKEINRTPSQVAINWARQQSKNIIPIIGARSEKHLKDNLGCLDFELTSEQIQRLNDSNPIDLGFPHTFLSSDHVRGLIFGETFSKTSN